MTDFLPSRKELLNALASIAAPVNKAMKKGQKGRKRLKTLLSGSGS